LEQCVSVSITGVTGVDKDPVKGRAGGGITPPPEQAKGIGFYPHGRAIAGGQGGVPCGLILDVFSRKDKPMDATYCLCSQVLAVIPLETHVFWQRHLEQGHQGEAF
jgi:hypothetical protein